MNEWMNESINQSSVPRTAQPPLKITGHLHIRQKQQKPKKSAILKLK